MLVLPATKRAKVLVAMSGGVDSSLAALLLKEAGYLVTGATMILATREKSESARGCGAGAVEDAKQVCRLLSIPHFVFDFSSLMEELVINKFKAEYLRGRTPNPCVDCNRHLKFGSLLDRARSMGFDYLATGHYARINTENGFWRLLRPRDRAKDQTYFLYPINAQDLPSIIFPLGEMSKDDVRKLAEKGGLHVADKHESQDICFVSGGNYRQFFQDRNVPSLEGNILDKHGRKLGRHRGIIHYTIGQRGGLGISAEKPLYVVEIDARKNQLIVGEKKDLLARGLIAGEVNLLTNKLPAELEAKIRYRKKPALCSVKKQNGRLKVVFAEAQESITPGQSVVFYAEDEVLGGGVIEEVIRPAD